MTTQVVFTIDPKIKALAMKRAKREGIPFASFLKIATESFARGEYGIGLMRTEKPNTKTARILLTARTDYKKGKNVSPAFSSGKDMDGYLGI